VSIHHTKTHKLRSQSKLLTLDVRVIWFSVSVLMLSIISLFNWGELMPFLWWRYLHLVSAAVFSGVVVISTLYEEMTLASGELTLIVHYQQALSLIDKRLVTVSVSTLLLSALAMLELSGLRLWSIDQWPLWASVSLITLSSLGLSWLAFDLPSQAIDLQKIGGLHSDPDQVIKRHRTQRRLINVVSVVTLLFIYGLMIFKPQ